MPMEAEKGASGGTRARVSVVIRAYNESKAIQRLFVGLRAQNQQDFEVIVVDSGSTDETVEIAKFHGARVVHLNKDDFSFGRSLNIGCREARGEILLFASAHVYPAHTDWISSIVEPFSDNRVALVYGKQRGNSATKFSEAQIFKTWFPEISDLNQQHAFCNNANCAIRKSWFDVLPYDESLTGLEDLAWAKEIIKRGGRIVYHAHAEIVHVHDETWERVRNRYLREAVALKHIEPQIQFSFLDFLRLAIANILSDFNEARRLGVLKKEGGNVVQFRLNQFWGTYLGHRFHSPMTTHVRERFYYPVRAAAKAKSLGDVEPPARSKKIDYPEYESI